jgi:cyanophycinase
MRVKKAVLFSMAYLLGLMSFGQSGKGSLVIAGGGIDPGNKSIYNQLIDLAGGPEAATFAIIPTASGTPVQSYAFIRQVLISYNVKEENIHIIPISLMDDDSTKDTDESKWAENGNDIQLAGTVRKCSGVWFTGGDQMRVTKALYRSDGSRTPVLEAVWEVYERGGVVGGTSAGAALMSEVMIGNGTSLGALQMDIITDNGPDNEDTDALLISRGLGFFPEGIIDQHFHARARLARLVIALMHSKDRFHMAFGVDENTALIYSASDRSIQVAGEAGVTIIDASDATISYFGGLPEINNLSVSYMEEGDRYLVPAVILTPAPGKKPTRGQESYTRPNPAQSGILSPNGATFLDLVTINLIDNSKAESVSNLTFTDHGNGFLLTFSKRAGSQGYYAESAEEEDLYTVSDIRLDISPVTVTVTKIH